MSKKKVKFVHAVSVVRQNEIEVKVVSYNTNLLILPKEGFSVTIIKLIYKIIRQNIILILIIHDHE